MIDGAFPSTAPVSRSVERDRAVTIVIWLFLRIINLPIDKSLDLHVHNIAWEANNFSTLSPLLIPPSPSPLVRSTRARWWSARTVIIRARDQVIKNSPFNNWTSGHTAGYDLSVTKRRKISLLSYSLRIPCRKQGCHEGRLAQALQREGEQWEGRGYGIIP